MVVNLDQCVSCIALHPTPVLDGANVIFPGLVSLKLSFLT